MAVIIPFSWLYLPPITFAVLVQPKPVARNPTITRESRTVFIAIVTVVAGKSCLFFAMELPEVLVVSALLALLALLARWGRDGGKTLWID